MYKRISALLLSAVLLFTLASCYDPSDPLGAYTLSDHVTLGKYLGISYIPAEREVTQADIDTALKELQEEFKTSKKITNRPAQTGDEVDVTYSIAVNGETISDNLNEKLVLGAAVTDETADRYIDGFEEAVLGLSVNEKKQVSLTFPTDFYRVQYAGLTCDFTITLTSITEYTLPGLTDDFIKKKTEYDTLDAYIAALRPTLAEEKKSKAISEDLNNVWNKVLENATFTLPEDRVEKYVDEEMSVLEDYAEKSGITVEKLLNDVMKMTQSEYLDYCRAVAERRVKEEFAFYAIAEKENLLLTPEEFDEKARELATHYESDVDTFLETWGEEYIHITLQGQKVMEFVLEKAVHTEKQ